MSQDELVGKFPGQLKLTSAWAFTVRGQHAQLVYWPGIKRSLLTEAQGSLIGPALEGASRHGISLTESPLRSLPPAAGNARDAQKLLDHAPFCLREAPGIVAYLDSLLKLGRPCEKSTEPSS